MLEELGIGFLLNLFQSQKAPIDKMITNGQTETAPTRNASKFSQPSLNELISFAAKPKSVPIG